MSVTLTVKILVLGPCASAGVQEKTPLAGLIVAPGGGLTRLKLSVLAGTSESLALAVKLIGNNS